MTSSKLEDASHAHLRWQPGGKPVLEGPVPMPDISISHDGDLCLVGLGSHAQGIDLETIKARDHASWVALLGGAFEAMLALLGREEPLDTAGTRVWSAREAILKESGRPCQSLEIVERRGAAVLLSGRVDERTVPVLTYPVGTRMVALVVESPELPARTVTKSGPVPAMAESDAIPAPLAHLYPSGKVNPFEIHVETSGPHGQPVFRYRFPLTFQDCSDMGRGAYFARYLAWMGQIRELSVASILPQLKELFTSGHWGSVTNGWETFHFDEANQDDLVEGRFYATRRHGRFDAAFDLVTEWTAIDRNQAVRPLALTTMTASWVEVTGHAEVRLAPMPEFFDDYMRLMVSPVGEPGRGAFDPSLRPDTGELWGEVRREYRRGDRGWPVVHTASFQTALDHANLVGNVYYSNYPRWAGVTRDTYFFEMAPELFRGTEYQGDFLCRRMKVDHLREAMPFDRVVVEMSVKAVYERGAALAFEYFREEPAGGSIKLAVGQQDIVFARRSPTGMVPQPLPRAVAQALEDARSPALRS